MAEADPTIDPLIGQTLNGAYRVIRLMSHGGAGYIYEAQHTRLPKRVAIKVVRRELLTDQVVFERFWREAQIAAALGNPHLVQAQDFDRLPDGTPYMVMEFLEGEDLGQRLARRGRLPPREALDVLRQVVDALSAAHRQGVVHRDLKPENIFIAKTESGSEVVKVLDFGASKVKGLRKLTAELTAVGTPWYMSPEQAQALPDTDARSDQYAAATVFFEMIAGRPPFCGESAVEVMNQIVYEPAPKLSLRAPNAPVSLDPVLARALAKLPVERYLGVDAFLEAVDHALEPPIRIELADVILDARQPDTTARSPSRARFSWPAFAVGVALVIVAGAFFELTRP